MTQLTPGARFFLEQRKAQGKSDVTEAQADALAALMVPVRVTAAAPRRCDASPAGGPRGATSPKDAA